MLHAVILAGGSGTRLWPESRESKAKQFLTFESKRTMIESTVERLDPLVTSNDVWVLATRSMADQIGRVLPKLPSEHLVAEPVPRNTAPCIGLAAIKLLREDPDATMVVLPSDHVIRPETVFRDTLRLAADLVDEDPRRLVTLGIKPSFPSSSYGYIQRSEALRSPVADRWKQLTTPYHAVRFHEKPTKERAVEFIDTGRFAWNAGIFVWKARTIVELLGRFEPEIGALLETISQSLGSPDEETVTERCFPEMKKISIDYAVMERAESIVMLEATFSWDDVGTWCALDRLYADRRDDKGNLVEGAKLLAIDSTNCIVRANDPRHLFALLGMEDIVVVQTDDATLIARKDHEESVRAIIEELKKRHWNNYL